MGIRIFYMAFGVLAVIIGGGTLAWLFYNLFVERLVGFMWSPSWGLGIGPATVATGLNWLRKAFTT